MGSATSMHCNGPDEERNHHKLFPKYMTPGSATERIGHLSTCCVQHRTCCQQCFSRDSNSCETFRYWNIVSPQVHCSSDRHAPALPSSLFFSAEYFFPSSNFPSALSSFAQLRREEKRSAEKKQQLSRAAMCISEEQCICGPPYWKLRFESKSGWSIVHGQPRSDAWVLSRANRYTGHTRTSYWTPVSLHHTHDILPSHFHAFSACGDNRKQPRTWHITWFGEISTSCRLRWRAIGDMKSHRNNQRTQNTPSYYQAG